MNEYEVKAKEFLNKNNIRFSVVNTTEECPSWDSKNYHFKHTVRFYNRNTKRSMTVQFYTSLQDYCDGNDNCTAYDVLSCLQKYKLGTLDDFIHEFGYEINSAEDFYKTKNTYKACCREWSNVQRVFADCMEELREIC